MSTTILARAVLVASFALAPGAPVQAQSDASTQLTGTISDYSDTANVAGAWHLTGEWSAKLDGRSGRGSFAVGIAMGRATSGASPHTHHVFVDDGVVTPLANGTGLAIVGLATITSNGAVAGFSGTTVTIELTGNSEVYPSNIKIIFSGGAIGHFGADPIDGVVRVTP